MQYIRRFGRAMAIAAGLFLGVAGTMPAFAVGTTVGTPVINDVTLDYEVNTVAQQTTAQTQFNVDEKLAINLATADSDWVTAVAGQVVAGNDGTPSMNFTLTNLSNTDVHVVIAVIDRGNSVPVTGFTPQVGSALTATSVSVAEDTNGNQAFDTTDRVLPVTTTGGGGFAFGTLVENAAPAELVVSANLAGAAGDHASFTVVAALSTGPLPADAVMTVDDSGNFAPWLGSGSNAVNTLLGVETVFADLDAASAEPEDIRFDFSTDASIAGADGDFNAQSSDTSGLVVGATMSIAKYVEVLYDPISGNRYLGGAAVADPKAIPGAVMMYVVGLVNDSAALTAEDVDVSDDIPDGSGSPELVDEGDQANPSTAIEVPASVSFTVGSTAMVPDLTSVANLDEIYVSDCTGSGTSNGYNGAGVVVGGDDTAALEFTHTVGDCDAGDTAYLVYFVTVN